jgi:hypothetical protein
MTLGVTLFEEKSVICVIPIQACLSSSFAV